MANHGGMGSNHGNMGGNHGGMGGGNQGGNFGDAPPLVTYLHQILNNLTAIIQPKELD